MPIVVTLSLALQVICAAHAIKTGRPYSWVLVILLFPGIGSLLYFFLEMLPDLRHSSAGRRTVKNVLKTFDPQMDLKKAARELRLSDNVENKSRLAGECLESGLHTDAEDLYLSCLHGVYENDPKILLGLATAQFGGEKYVDTKATLDRLIQTNPDFKSPDGHLLYARSLEAMGDEQAALEEYRILASYAGTEAKCRYGLLLKKCGHTEQANRVFREISDYAKDAPSFYRRTHKQWIAVARQNLD